MCGSVTDAAGQHDKEGYANPRCVRANVMESDESSTPAPPLGAFSATADFGVDAIAGYVVQFMEEAKVALAMFDATGHVLYSNLPARLFATSLNPDRSSEELAVVFNWHEGLVTAETMESARTFGRWAGKLRLGDADMQGRVLQLRLHPLGPQRSFPFMLVILDITQETAREMELHERNAELEVAYAKLKSAQEQALHAEKMASIGQLAAGVAHEINNPIAYVKSNLGALRLTAAQLLNLARIPECENDLRQIVAQERAEDDEDPGYDNIAIDTHDLIMESLEGVDRVCKIVSDLKDFSRQGQIDSWAVVDVQVGLESTLNIVWNEIKYKAHVVKSYGELPLIECIPSQLNQVFMNLLVNAAQSIEGKDGIITISTECVDDQVIISIGDNGAGIPEAVLPKIFDPFFTTKEVGRGTGLGLAISYGIMQKHHGSIEVTSVAGEGTLFLLKLPVKQPH